MLGGGADRVGAGPLTIASLACAGGRTLEAPLMMWLRLMRPPLLKLAILLGVSEPVAAQNFAVDDTTAYCRQLSDLYRRFVLPPAGWGADLDATYALEACRKGNPEGIPVLEKKLRENRGSLPGREFKP
jgi:hypothetical protein